MILPQWPAPGCVRAASTTRYGGVSIGPYASFNLASHVGDTEAAVQANRARLRQQLELPAEPLWLNQVHGSEVAEAGDDAGTEECPAADAAFARSPGRVCAVMTADCLPVLMCDRDGTVVAAAHAGWRGLAGGVLEATVASLGVEPRRLLAWLGPAIGPAAFEVGSEVLAAFTDAHASAAAAFVPQSNGCWLADIYHLARIRLAAAGVEAVYGGGFCTFADQARFYSFRRDKVTGRMVSLIWLV